MFQISYEKGLSHITLFYHFLFYCLCQNHIFSV